MNEFIAYLISVLKHKWYVFIECCRLGIPIQGVLHDLSKFLPAERLPRIKALRARCNAFQYEDLYCDLHALECQVIECWNHHYHNNPHHWQYWVVYLDNGEQKVLPIPERYRKEMLADWLAVSRNPERSDIYTWYYKWKDKLVLHPDTRQWLEIEIRKRR
jgi:hypothetical protein